MSEYQWVHFRAIDKPLDDDALQFMRRQSTRAAVSRWEFSNEYNFGSFGGQSSEMLRRGYDVHLHYANYGVRHLAFRLPELPCDKKTFKRFAVKHGLEWDADKQGTAGTLWVMPEGQDAYYEYFEECDSMINRIAPAREMLLRGDLRPLYLFWLVVCEDDDRAEPPVPPGLMGILDGTADDCLLAIADFLQIPHELLEAASKCSPQISQSFDVSAAIGTWVRKQSKPSLVDVTEQLLNDPATRNRLVRQIRKEAGGTKQPTNESGRTVGDLVERWRAIGWAKTQVELAAQRKRDEEREAARQKARVKELKQIAANPMALIRRIDGCVARKNRKGYQEATLHLKDIGEALGDDAAQAGAERLRHEHPSYSALHDELNRAGF